MENLKKYISSKLDVLLESEESDKKKAQVVKNLKALGVPKKTIRKALDKLKNVELSKPKENKPKKEPAEKIHSKNKIKNTLNIRDVFRGKDISDIKTMTAEKEAFVKHYDELFNKGISEMPGIMELYSILSNNGITKAPSGEGFVFKMTPEDAKLYGKDIVKYFLTKNEDIFPVVNRAKISFDSYLFLMGLSGVNKKHINDTKNHYYNKLGIKQ